jgi:protoporphyrinogen oxidase
MAENIERTGGKIRKEYSVVKVKHENFEIKSVVVWDKNRNEDEFFGDHFLSSMPITELVKRMEPEAPKEVIEAAEKLTYRGFITISVILDSPSPFPDTWIYVHSPEAKMGRIQNFKKWSPFMVPDKSKTTLGLEYFASEGDELWNMKDDDLLKLGMEELEKIGLGKKASFVDGFVSRILKTYPVYDSTYPENLSVIKRYLKNFKNLQPIGRYGMFKYNNMDHSILTGLYAAENILGASHDIWNVNADQEYQEKSKNKS